MCIEEHDEWTWTQLKTRVRGPAQRAEECMQWRRSNSVTQQNQTNSGIILMHKLWGGENKCVWGGVCIEEHDE